jgi:hypothetical protein
MPKITTWVPLYDKLPASLYGPNFTLVVNPKGEPQAHLYLFHDKTWMADSTHMLGWSREITHCLSAGRDPLWLCGHAFERVDDKTYEVSGSGTTVTVDQLIAWAKEAQEQLAVADVTVGQWGDESHDDFPAALTREHDKVIRNPSEKFHRAALGDDLKFHVVRCNSANEVHHPEYPSKETK